jgi:hypothetical protein
MTYETEISKIKKKSIKYSQSQFEKKILKFLLLLLLINIYFKIIQIDF